MFPPDYAVWACRDFKQKVLNGYFLLTHLQHCYFLVTVQDSAVFLMRRNRCPNSASRLTFHLCNNAGGGAPTSRAALPFCLPPTFLPPAFPAFTENWRQLANCKKKLQRDVHNHHHQQFLIGPIFHHQPVPPSPLLHTLGEMFQ